ncbi:MAG: SGNH/GDSL hydrolase family protein [Bacteroidota bacterium]
MPLNKRRDFLKQVTGFGAASLVPASLAAIAAPVHQGKQTGYTLLFQGDSITDGNRTRNNDWNHIMGHGYQYIISSNLWCDHPSKQFNIFNRGISGNNVTDLAARWQKDTLDLQPDLLSILIGINDVATLLNGDKNYSAEAYESRYRDLLNETRKSLPQIQLILCEPFVLPVGKVKENWEMYSSEVKKRQTIVKLLATEYNAIHVPFQSAFDRALEEAPASYWIWDGIHPMPAGHALMAREWTKQVSKNLKFLK